MIDHFRGKYGFLSNFYDAQVLYEGILYPSSEHAFMAAKTTDPERRKYIAGLPSPSAAKRAGRMLTLRPDWEKLKYQVMLDVLTDKFNRNPHLREQLLETGEQELVEGNTWGDTVWGVCDGVGQNLLGKLLMLVRTNLRKPMKLIIAGGRDFNDRALMVERLQELENQGIINERVELICGMAKGADNLGRLIFEEANLPIHAFYPDWDGLGKRAGFVRNAEMGEAADMALIFWDGQSKGTKHMIDYMDKMNKPCYVVRY